MKKLKILIFILVGVSLISGPFVNRIAVAYSPEYKWTDANNIDAQDNDNPNNPNSNQTYTFTSKTGKEYKYTINNGGCSYIIVQAKTGEAEIFVQKLFPQDCTTGKYDSNSITIKGELPIEIKKNQDLDPANNNPVNCNANPDDARCKDQEPADKPCFLAIPVFGWILCPILDFANVLYDWMFGIIRNLLFIPEATYNNSEGLKTSWNNMKNIASAIIVLVALVMIAAQIFNFEFISAYTVKKALPRLVIAAIAIQLSWYIFTLLIQITNGVGAGIYNLLTLPFDTGDILNDIGRQNSSVGSGSQAFSGLLALAGLGAGAIAAIITALTPGGWMTLVLVSIGAIVSMLVALVTLIVRKMLIITLLVLSPVALALWILPGTQKVWSSWWQLFSKLLIMFPLIMILFAAGQIFASTLSNIDESGIVGSVNLIMLVVAFFAPLFLVPATFKAAGGIFGQISAFLSGGGKKISGSGFGLRRRRDAYRKVSDEMKANELTAKARRVGTKALDPNASNFQKVRGRAQLGASGFLPGGAKRLATQQARYAGQIENEEMQEANLMFSARTRQMQFGDKVEQATRIAEADGDSITIKVPKFDSSGKAVMQNGQQVMEDQEMEVNDSMRRVAAKYVADAGDADRSRSINSTLIEQKRTDVASRIADDNVGSLLKIAPDIYGKGADDLGHRELAGVKPATLRNYGQQFKSWHDEMSSIASQPTGQRTQKEQQRYDLLQARVNRVSQEATRAINDTDLSIAPESRPVLEAMATQDAARVDALTGGKDFRGRDITNTPGGQTSPGDPNKRFLASKE